MDKNSIEHSLELILFLHLISPIVVFTVRMLCGLHVVVLQMSVMVLTPW